MSDNEKTDWNFLLSGYNHFKKTSHKTVTEMLTDLYAQEQTLIKVCEVLGVSRQTVCNKMKSLNIPRLPKGHRGKSKCTKAIIALGDVSKMTALQIAIVVDFTRTHVALCLRREKILYRKGRI